MEGWKTYRLGDIADVQTGPFGTQLHQKDYIFIGTPIITVEHLGENKIIHNNLPQVSEADKSRLAKYILKEGDIVFSRVGSVDRRAYVTKDEDGWLFSGRCLRVRLIDNEICSRFLSFYFGLNTFTEYIRSIAHGSTMPSLNTSLLQELEFVLPPLHLQQRIAEILSALDDKIELNRQMNGTLEGMAQALYKHYFVDDIDLENLPEGWKIGNILEIADLFSGGTPKTEKKDYWDGHIKWLSAKDITENNKGFIVETEKHISESGLKYSAAKLLPKFTTVITARGTVGKYCLLSEEMAISQSNYGLKSKFNNLDFFIFLLLENMIALMQQYAYGTVFDTITTKTFQEIEIIIPPIDLEFSFEGIVQPLFQHRLSLTIENASLILIRDTLLPKLISGEIIPSDLKNIEKSL